MRTGLFPTRTVRVLFPAVLALGCALSLVSSTSAQLLYSFEPDLQGWAPTGFGGSDLIGVTHSTLGATDGTHSMAVERGNAIGDSNGFSWDVGRTVTTAALPDVYAIFQSVAADPTNYALDFDVTITPESFAEVASSGPFFSINVSANGSAAGENNFNQVLNVVPDGSADGNLIGVDGMGQPAPKLGTHHISIPLNSALGGGPGLYFVPDSTYYQLNIGSNLTNALFMNGPNGEGATYFVDNIRFRELPQTVEETIFSWETPDNPATPEVNEQLEGWIGGNFPGNPPHAHAITTTGATHGTSALEIDRTSLDAGFTWGSLFVLNSDTNPDPEVEEIDPVIQTRIEELIAKIESAESVAFDVTFQYQDLFPLPDPTYTNFAVHFSDESGVFYQRAGQNIDVRAAADPTTVTVEIPLDEFVDANTGTLTLKTDGFIDDSHSFRIGISTSTDGAQIYQIDNFRLISLAPEGLPGDYNGDGVVDAADYTVWRDHFGSSSTLPNDTTPGMVTQEDYVVWKENFGNAVPASGGSLSGQSPAAVPEPGTVVLAMLALASGLLCGRRGCSVTCGKGCLGFHLAAGLTPRVAHDAAE